MVHFDGEAADFDNFDMNYITQHVGHHISGRKRVDERPFASHFISTTDSFEAAINRAHRHLAEKNQKKKVSDIAMYVIDTYSLQAPALPLLMFLVFKAWNVSSVLTQTKCDMFLYNALTEWIFFDRIVAKNVEKIDYSAFATPKRNSGQGLWRLHLGGFIPLHTKAAKAKHNTKDGMSRSVLHAITYHSREQQKEIGTFADNVFVGRIGRLPKAPQVVQEDTRSIVSDKTIKEVWSMVRGWQNSSLMLVWILSLMTKTYHAWSIAEAIARLYPHAIREHLHLIQDDSQQLNSSRQVLVYYRSRPNCHGRVDINGFQDLMEGCIYEWDKRKASDTDPANRTAIVFISTEHPQPVRNLVRLQQQGLFGHCTTIPMFKNSAEVVRFPDLANVTKNSKRVIQRSKNDEDYQRLMSLYPSYLPYVPDFAGIGLETIQKQPMTDGPQSAAVDESRLLGGKNKQPPSVPVPGSPGSPGYGSQVARSFPRELASQPSCRSCSISKP
ncbi:hypothetical protein H2198_000749 [Neophaeococcomyces mojaviensis]|uniref:Uncharacterized protein n=1 Tax=Neophaeococcomyces mojaviensis TaxID=3383035 RepID=A0ACC3AJ15_9EURO|nr:hypothetical protein H2198_000749 [Knufia sp. JES_112]